MQHASTPCKLAPFLTNRYNTPTNVMQASNAIRSCKKSWDPKTTHSQLCCKKSSKTQVERIPGIRRWAWTAPFVSGPGCSRHRLFLPSLHDTSINLQYILLQVNNTIIMAKEYQFLLQSRFKHNYF